MLKKDSEGKVLEVRADQPGRGERQRESIKSLIRLDSISNGAGETSCTPLDYRRKLALARGRGSVSLQMSSPSSVISVPRFFPVVLQTS